jgi:hypothetical protein
MVDNGGGGGGGGEGVRVSPWGGVSSLFRDVGCC